MLNGITEIEKQAFQDCSSLGTNDENQTEDKDNSEDTDKPQTKLGNNNDKNKPQAKPESNDKNKPQRKPAVTAVNKPVRGSRLIEPNTKDSYVVTETGLSVSFSGMEDEKAVSAIIPAVVRINGITYKVTSIADNAFSGNKELKNVKIGSNVTSIGKKAFYKCTNLKKIILPSKVSKIGKQAFAGCKKLKYINIKTLKLTPKNVGRKAFSGIHKNVKVKMPKKKMMKYKKFLNI